MPNPIEILIDPISLLILALYGGLLLLEAAFPGRRLPPVKGARVRGALTFVTFFYAATYLPLFWDEFLGQFRWFDLTALPWGLGALVGLLAYEFVAYWYHRGLHASDRLFRSVHQMHHSSERLDAWSAFYFGPLDMIGWSLVGSLGLVVLVGVSPTATTVALVAINFLGIFQHTNIKTPQWLGYFVQRPESHTLHHGRGIHAGNYADLPVFDLVFGTFVNPKGFECPTGYYDGASARVWDMVLMRDVTRPGAHRSRSRGQARVVVNETEGELDAPPSSVGASFS